MEEDSYQLLDLEKLVFGNFFFKNTSSPLPPQSDHPCCWVLMGTDHHLNGQPERQPNSTYLGPFYGIHWTKETSQLHGSMKGESSESCHFYTVLFFSAGIVSNNRKGMHAGSSMSLSSGLPRKTSNEGLGFSLCSWGIRISKRYSFSGS